MRLAVDGLEVSPLTAADLEPFVAYRSDPAVARYQSWDAAYSAADALTLLASQEGWDFPPAGEWMQFGIRSSGALVGDIAVHRLSAQPDTFELGVTIAPAGQGHGVATRVVGAVVSYLFASRGAHRVYAECDTRNAHVKAMLARAGFRHEGTAVESDWFKGEWTTVETWAVLAREHGERRPIS